MADTVLVRIIMVPKQPTCTFLSSMTEIKYLLGFGTRLPTSRPHHRKSRACSMDNPPNTAITRGVQLEEVKALLWPSSIPIFSTGLLRAVLEIGIRT